MRLTIPIDLPLSDVALIRAASAAGVDVRAALNEAMRDVQAMAAFAGEAIPAAVADSWNNIEINLADISPTSGPPAGGTTVTLRLEGAIASVLQIDSVQFDGIAATDVSYDGETGIITCTTPADDIGMQNSKAVDVQISFVQSTTLIIQSEAFTYQT